MTVLTTLDQKCSAIINSAGVERFQIVTSVSVLKTGDLPFKDIFVYKIISQADPKVDTFQRIGNVIDLTNLGIGRDAAIESGSVFYLSSAFTIDYPDVVTATAAKSLIQARVDQLIAAWKVYAVQFATPEFTTLPLVDPSLLAKLETDYYTAADAAAAAAATLATAITAAATTAAAVVTAEDTLETAQDDSTACADDQTRISLITSDEGTFLTSLSGGGALYVRIAALTAGNVVANLPGILSDLNSATAAIAVLGQGRLSSLVTSHGAECSAKVAAITTPTTGLIALKNAADVAAANAQTALTAANAAATAANAAAAAALAAVKAACPSFVP